MCFGWVFDGVCGVLFDGVLMSSSGLERIFAGNSGKQVDSRLR